MKPRVVVVGSIAKDYVFETERIANRGETVLGGRFRTAAGGKGANQAVAACRLGVDVHMVGSVGNDGNGDDLIRILADEGVHIDLVERLEGCSTGVASVWVENSSGDNAIVVAPGANLSETLEKRISGRDPRLVHVIREAQVVVTQLEVPFSAVREVARLSRELGVLVVVNPAPAVPLPVDLLEFIDILVPNEHELEISSNGNGIEFLSSVTSIITTLGSKGCEIRLRGEAATIPIEAASLPVGRQVVDTTGAGDCFCGALASFLAENINEYRRDPHLLIAAARFANRAAARSVTVRGALDSMPYRADLDRTI